MMDYGEFIRSKQRDVKPFGFVVAFVTQLIVFPLYGLPVSMGQNFGITVIFTAVSVVRSYLVRRWFNDIAKRRLPLS